MRKNFLLLSICAFTAWVQTSYAQENKNISIYFSGGNVMTSGKMKDSAFIKNGWNIEAGGYMPFYRKGWDGTVKGGSRFSLGLEAGINYASQKADGGSSVYNKNFPYQGGTLNPAFGNGTPHANSFQIFAGPKAEWVFGKIAVSPSILFGYFSLNRKGYSLSGTLTNPNQTTESKDITFIAAKDYKASGVVIKPGIELGYHLSRQISLFAKGVQSYGPSIKNNITLWVPQSNNGEKFYNYGQFLKGTEISKSISDKWQSTSVNIGLRIILNSMPSRLSMTPTTTRQTQGRDFGEKVAGGLQTNSIVNVDSSANSKKGIGGMSKPGGAVSSSYAAGKLISQGDSSSKNQMPSRLSMTPTTTRQTQGQNFGEKVAGGLQSGAVALSQGASRAQAQDFNTTRSNRERGQFLNTGNGNSSASVNDTSKTSITQAQDFNTTRSNRERGQFLNTGNGNNNASGNDTSKTSISTAQDFNTTRSNRERGQFLNTGNGNNNASGNDTSKTSISTAQDFNTTRNNKDNRLNTHPNSGSNNDSTSLDARKLRTPPSESYNPWDMDDANEETVVNPLYKENGGSASNPLFDPAAMTKPGNPIGGIIVKGGKNPGGQMMMITSDNNGEVTLNHLEKGNYFFTLNLPKKPSGKGINEAGIKRNEETKNPLYNGSETSGSNPMYESTKLTSPGNPIGGIIVKGGKNPGGSFIILTVNNHGQIGFEVLEAGNYKLILTAPANTKNSPAKKIKEKTSSGLKDTLKTNV